MLFLGSFIERHYGVGGKHLGLVGFLLTDGAQWLVAGVAEKHGTASLCY